VGIAPHEAKHTVRRNLEAAKGELSAKQRQTPPHRHANLGQGPIEPFGDPIGRLSLQNAQHDRFPTSGRQTANRAVHGPDDPLSLTTVELPRGTALPEQTALAQVLP
jgi:hypothetical protein